jgi:hypothetical protein
LPQRSAARILTGMEAWLIVALFAGLIVLTASRGLEVRRYSRGHITAQLTLRGHGLYVSRTPDGTWWKVRLRACPPPCAQPGDWGEPPPDIGVREPRRPLGPGPSADSIERNAFPS